MLITNNAIIGDGPIGNKTKCIYLDDGTSNTQVTKNLCAAGGGGSGGSFGVFIHAGMNDVVTNNTLDVANGAYAVGYQTRSGTNTALTPMSGNVFDNNSIYGSTNPLVWISGTATDPGLPPTPLVVANNRGTAGAINPQSLLNGQGPLPTACYTTAPGGPPPGPPTPCIPSGGPTPVVWSGPPPVNPTGPPAMWDQAPPSTWNGPPPVIVSCVP
jgi:hypothetical protein